MKDPMDTKREWQARNPEKHRAHKIFLHAKKHGLIKPQPCEKCGAKPAEGHHSDYSKPLEVMWLCRKHHRETHRVKVCPKCGGSNFVFLWNKHRRCIDCARRVNSECYYRRAAKRRESNGTATKAAS